MKTTDCSSIFKFFVHSFFIVCCSIFIIGCAGGSGSSSDSDDGSSSTASGTYTYSSNTLTLNVESSDYDADCGISAGDVKISDVTSLTATQMEWSNGMEWSRDSGTVGNIVGTWSFTGDDGDIFTLVLNADNSFTLSMIGSCAPGNPEEECAACDAEFCVFGASAGDTNLAVANRTLIGKANDSTYITGSGGEFEFDVSSFNRFIIMASCNSSKTLFDAIGLDSGWVDSSADPEYTHYTWKMVQTDGTSWSDSDNVIENTPDGDTMENTVGENSYYGFTTDGASTMRVYTDLDLD